ncbi:MAG: DUF6036 family nucleotidyltransferase [Candidatus Eremiobacterota bacterium]
MRVTENAFATAPTRASKRSASVPGEPHPGGNAQGDHPSLPQEARRRPARTGPNRRRGLRRPHPAGPAPEAHRGPGRPLRGLRPTLGELRLAHFQSHYLPQGWEARIQSLGSFGRLAVYPVDPLDIAVGKLFSRREKDLRDLHALTGEYSAARFRARVDASRSHLADPSLLRNLDRNWFVLFGQTFSGGAVPPPED